MYGYLLPFLNYFRLARCTNLQRCNTNQMVGGQQQCVDGQLTAGANHLGQTMVSPMQNNCMGQVTNNCFGPGQMGGQTLPMQNALNQFFAQYPNAPDALKQIMNIGGNNGNMMGGNMMGGMGKNGDMMNIAYELPDPQMLVSAVETATATYLDVKDHLRKVLEQIKMYLQRSAVMLAEITTDIKTKYRDLKETVEKHNKEQSEAIKAVLAKTIIDLRTGLMTKIKRFEDIRQWQMTITCAISSTL